VRAFQHQAEQLDRSTDAVAARDGVGVRDLAKLNDALTKVERAFLLEKGLPGRPWFKHSVYAPGLTTGYACWPLPAIRQDLEENQPARLAGDVARTVERIKRATTALQSAREAAQAAREAVQAAVK
jgi:N-acetylated-alpha-linked acidic dipeptidase